MGQPVKLSDELVSDARSHAQLAERSLAGQVEFWAQLGRAVESLLRGEQLISLRRGRIQPSVCDALSEVETEDGRRRLDDYLKTRPFPHYEAISGVPGLFRRIEADGTESIGRFVNRDFVLTCESDETRS